MVNYARSLRECIFVFINGLNAALLHVCCGEHTLRVCIPNKIFYSILFYSSEILFAFNQTQFQYLNG